MYVWRRPEQIEFATNGESEINLFRVRGWTGQWRLADARFDCEHGAERTVAMTIKLNCNCSFRLKLLAARVVTFARARRRPRARGTVRICCPCRRRRSTRPKATRHTSSPTLSARRRCLLFCRGRPPRRPQVKI